MAEAEVEAVEHLAPAQLLQRRRHRSIRAAASASPSEFGCGVAVEDWGVRCTEWGLTDWRWADRQEVSEG